MTNASCSRGTPQTKKPAARLGATGLWTSMTCGTLNKSLAYPRSLISMKARLSGHVDEAKNAARIFKAGGPAGVAAKFRKIACACWHAVRGWTCCADVVGIEPMHHHA